MKGESGLKKRNHTLYNCAMVALYRQEQNNWRYKRTVKVNHGSSIIEKMDHKSTIFLYRFIKVVIKETSPRIPFGWW